MAKLEDQLAAEKAPSWNPHKEPDHDPHVVGVLLTRGIFNGDFGQSPIHTIDRGDESPDAKPPGRFINFFVFGAVAAGEDEEKHPQEGERIAWLFKGTGVVREGANKGKEYPVFRLFVERDGNKPAVSDFPAPEPFGGEVPSGEKNADGDDIPFCHDDQPGYIETKARWNR
jgi:hypothetical protein